MTSFNSSGDKCYMQCAWMVHWSWVYIIGNIGRWLQYSNTTPWRLVYSISYLFHSSRNWFIRQS